MWRCPKCVTHVKDEQAECPTCRHARPEQSPEADADDRLLDELFPQQPPDEEPLIPALHHRDLAKGAGHLPLRGFLFGFGVGLVVTFVVYWWNESGKDEEGLVVVVRGLFYGSIAGVLVGSLFALTWQMWEPLYWSFAEPVRPADPGLSAALAQMPEAPEEENPFDGEWADQQTSEDTKPNTAPGPIPPPPLPNKEPPDAFRPAL